MREPSYLPFVSWLSLRYHPILQTHLPLASRFSFYPFCFCSWWKDRGRNRTSMRDLHNVPVIRLISGLPNSVGSHRLMSCAWHSWLVWLPFVCLRFYYLASADRFYLYLFSFLACYCGRRWFIISHTGVVLLCGPSAAQHGLYVSWGC